jgi:hypothetical protein
VSKDRTFSKAFIGDGITRVLSPAVSDGYFISHFWLLGFGLLS